VRRKARPRSAGVSVTSGRGGGAGRKVDDANEQDTLLKMRMDTN
jgi:hypothetical protein